MIKVTWQAIKMFPEYDVSDYGQIRNRGTGKHLSYSYTRHGDYKVGLVRGGVQYTRSVKLLVAEAFVEGRTDIHDTPIQLDGHQENVRASNLAWRPRWFAWKYFRQFHEIAEIHNKGPVIDIDSRERYADVIEAAVVNGLLFTGVWDSILMRRPTFPTGQRFDLVRTLRK